MQSSQNGGVVLYSDGRPRSAGTEGL